MVLVKSMIDVSFCISTYNRVSSIVPLVKSLLNYEGENIEVVVLDNGSTDSTISELSKINDKRFKYFTNGENKGALFNMVNVLEKGNGDYLVFSTDKDAIDVNYISNFIDFIKSAENLLCGYCFFKHELNKVRSYYSVGYEGISNIAYKGRHPSGYFFKKANLDKLKIRENFSDYEKVDLFPLEFVFAEICSIGKSGIFEAPLFIQASGKPAKGQQSLTTNGNSKNAFFNPKSRLKMSIRYSLHILSLNLSFISKLKLLMNIYFEGLINSTIGYRQIMNNDNLCLHYFMDKKNISVLDMSKTFLKYSFYYFKDFWIKGNYIKFSFLFFPLFIIISVFRGGFKFLVSKLKKKLKL